jgi:hypothetical protein
MTEVTDKDLDAAAAAGRTSPDEVFDALLGLIGLIRQNGDANVIFDERYKAAREVAKAYL